MKKRTRSVLASLAVTPLLLAAVPASASPDDVPGSWNRGTSSHTVANIDALSNGRQLTFSTWSAYRDWIVNGAWAVTTAYTADGQKLWVVDARGLRNKVVGTAHYNKDRQRMRPGWIMSTCVMWDVKFGPDKTACVKNRV